MTFLEWCLKNRKRQDGVGDFCRDWISDKGRPKGAVSAQDIKNRLWECDASDTCTKIVGRVWRDYQKEQS